MFKAVISYPLYWEIDSCLTCSCKVHVFDIIGIRFEMITRLHRIMLRQDNRMDTGERAYEKIINYVEQQVMHGRYKKGDKLPPERELAALLGASEELL